MDQTTIKIDQYRLAVEVPPAAGERRKTKVWRIETIKGCKLGTISWQNSMLSYVFTTVDGLTLDGPGLVKIGEFCIANTKRRATRV